MTNPKSHTGKKSDCGMQIFANRTVLLLAIYKIPEGSNKEAN
jgi:hypothetical protein